MDFKKPCLHTTNTALLLYRGAYKGRPCVLIEGYLEGMTTALFTDGEKPRAMAHFDDAFTRGDVLDEWAAFTGTIQIGHHAKEKQPGVVLLPEGKSTSAYIYFAQGPTRRHVCPPQEVVLGKPKVKRKELRAQLADALALADERAAELAQVKQDLEDVSKLAASRLQELANQRETIKQELLTALAQRILPQTPEN